MQLFQTSWINLQVPVLVYFQILVPNVASSWNHTTIHISMSQYTSIKRVVTWHGRVDFLCSCLYYICGNSNHDKNIWRKHVVSRRACMSGTKAAKQKINKKENNVKMYFGCKVTNMKVESKQNNCASSLHDKLHTM